MRALVFVPLFIFSYLSTLTAQDHFEGIQVGSNPDKGQYVTIDSIDIYYETYGSGTPLLLLHGGLGSISNFTHNIPELANHFQVIAVDSPGHGRSGKMDSLSYSLLSEYIEGFIDHLSLDSAYILGWSDGGVIGYHLAANRPEKIKKLVAIGANTQFDGMDSNTIHWIQNNLIQWAKDNKSWMDHYLSLTSDPEYLDDYLHQTQTMWMTDIYITDELLTTINIPTLILQGDKDLLKLEHTAHIYRSINNAQLCIIPNTTHFCISEKPKLVNDIILKFLSE